jgi:hypothetical protein
MSGLGSSDSKRRVVIQGASDPKKVVELLAGIAPAHATGRGAGRAVIVLTTEDDAPRIAGHARRLLEEHALGGGVEIQRWNPGRVAWQEESLPVSPAERPQEEPEPDLAWEVLGKAGWRQSGSLARAARDAGIPAFDLFRLHLFARDEAQAREIGQWLYARTRRRPRIRRLSPFKRWWWRQRLQGGELYGAMEGP